MKTIKVLAGSLAAITAGATLALGIFAAPATTLGDFVKVSGNALNSPVIVVGETINPGYNMDVVGAADIAAAVAGYATTSVSAGAVGLGVSGGAEIGTTNTKLYLGDPLTKSGVKSTLTKADLPTLLASGSMTDTGGTTYNYDQYLTLQGGTAITYGNSGGDLTDPDLLLNLSTTAASIGVINYTITFNKLLNISSANVQSQRLKLLGIDYTIGATSTCTSIATSKLVLYGSSLVQTMAGGEEKKITVDNKEYTVKVLGASSSTAAVVSVDGTTQSVTKGISYLIAGLAVYVEDVFYLSSTEITQNSVKLSFGTNKLTLENGATVKKGTSDDTVDGTLVAITGTANNGISKLEVSVAATDSSHDYAKQGAAGAFVDPVFGSFKLALGGISGGSTEKVTVDNSGTTGASLRFTDYRGNEKTVNFAYATSATAIDLNSTSTATFIVVENTSVKKSDYILLAPSLESEFSHLMQYTTASSLGSSGAYIELKDAMSDATSRFYLTDAGYGTGEFYIDGQKYNAQNISSSAQTFAFTWGAGADSNNPGSLLTVQPLVKTSKGGWVTLIPGNRSAVTSSAVWIPQGNTTLELPGGYGTATEVVIHNAGGKWQGVRCGTTFNVSGSIANNTGVMCSDGRLAWNITVVGGGVNTTYVTLDASETLAVRPAYPTVLFKEEKGKNLANSDVQDWVYATVKDGTGSGLDLTVDTPVLSASTQYSQALQSDNSVTNYIDRYGTMVKYDSDSQGLVEITYSDEQGVATVAVGDNPAFGAGGAGTVQAAVKITSPVAKIASEVSATAPGADLILVGGPCVNSLVKKLLGATSCDTWNYTTGIIKQVTTGFTDGSRALIVAGTAAADTRALAARVMQGTLTYEA